MAEQRVVVIGGGLAGLAASMKLAELGISSHMPRLASTERVWKPCNAWYASVGSSGRITSAYRSQARSTTATRS